MPTRLGISYVKVWGVQLAGETKQDVKRIASQVYAK